MAKFNFLNKVNDIENNQIYQLLNKYGKEIYDYAKEYLNYIVTYSTTENNNISSISLYILVPEIKYEYKILEIELSNYKNNKVKSIFYNLITKQTEINEIDITNGSQGLDNYINDLLSLDLTNKSFRFLIDQVELKREYEYA